MKNNSVSDGFLKIKRKCDIEEKVKDSRFIATAAPVDSEKEADDFISGLKKNYHDASHNCSAWRIGTGSNARYRFNDDGEPSGTAGRPILKAIEARDISNICVVVTRYFGGTKLGTGGLARAYGQITGELLKKCEIEKKYVTKTASFSIAFDFMSVVHKIIDNFGAELKDTQYHDDVLFVVEIKSSNFVKFKEKLTEATNGQIVFR